MGKVFVDVGMTLDGYLAGPNARPDNPMGDGAHRMHVWIFGLATFRERLGLGSGGVTGRDDDLVREVFERTGAHVMGRRMFDEGEVAWPERAPFRKPVYVATHRAREPWTRPGGTTFHFVTEGVMRALELAREAAGDKDVRVSGGANVIQQLLHARAIDELTLHIAPVLLGAGVPLFDGLDAQLEIVETIPSDVVTHVRYRVAKVK